MADKVKKGMMLWVEVEKDPNLQISQKAPAAILAQRIIKIMADNGITVSGLMYLKGTNHARDYEFDPRDLENYKTIGEPNGTQGDEA